MKKSKSLKSSVQSKNQSHEIEHLSYWRLWLFRLIAIIIIPLTFFVLIEASLRIFNYGYPTTALIEIMENNTRVVYENSEFSNRFFPKKLTQKFVPIRFNTEKPEGAIRIFILGGSAAQGIPDPAYSFGRILEVMLKLRYPDTKFEVHPLAMTAINSHVVLEIAKDCVKYDPDLFIVYLGNNEVVGPYGPGTILTTIISNSFLLDLTKKLNTTKISQLIIEGMEKVNLLRSPYSKWKGMEMFADNIVRKSDPELQIAYQNFSKNLESLNQISQENNIKIIYNTVVSNLKDCPPFNSVHRADIKELDIKKWEKHYSEGSAFEEAGDYSAAITEYLEAEKIDNEYADLNYKLGWCYWQIGEFAQAAKSYTRALEYDCNRFRADNRINEIIRSAAAEKPGITFLSDALFEVQRQSPNRVVGNEFLFEHVHLKFNGNFILAKSILAQLDQIFSDDLKDQVKNNTISVSDSLIASNLAYGNYEHHRILDLVLNGFIKQPPFSNQLYHAETIKNLEAELDSLQFVVEAQHSNLTINTFKEALQKRPGDWLLHNKLADYLADDNVRKFEEALDHYQFVMNALPHYADVIVKRGVVLAKLGKLQESIIHFQKALSIDSELAKVYFNLGLVYQKLKKIDLTIENYNKALLYEPTHSKAYNNLAFIYSSRENTSKALETIELGLKYIPNDLLLNYNKAMILYKTNRKREAVKQLKYVLQIAPNEVKIEEKLNEWLNIDK